MLNGIHSAVDNFDNLIQNNKCSLPPRLVLSHPKTYFTYLQTGQFDQSLHSPSICLSALLHLLSALSQSCQPKIIIPLSCEAFKCWQEDSRNVFLLGAYAETGTFNGFLDLVADGTSNCVCDFCEGESSDLHYAAHLSFGFIDTAGDFLGRLEGTRNVWMEGIPLNRLC